VKEPELVSATREELDEILALAKTSFPPKHYQLLGVSPVSELESH